MRKIPFAVLYVFASRLAALSVALPPTRPSVELTDALLRPNAEVSTDLALGLQASSTPTQSHAASTRPLAHPVHFPLTDTNQEPRQPRIRTSTKHLQASTSYRGEQAGVRDSVPLSRQLIPDTLPHLVTEEVRAIQRTPRGLVASTIKLDAHIGPAQNVPGQGELWSVSKDIDYVPYSRFNLIYRDLVSRWPRKSEWKEGVRPHIPLHELQQVLDQQRRFFLPGLSFFKTVVVSDRLGADEVLVHLHARASWVGIHGQQKYISVWKTAESGSRLVFLGMYRCSRAFLKDVLLNTPSVQAFQVVQLGPTGGTYLMPEGARLSWVRSSHLDESQHHPVLLQ